MARDTKLGPEDITRDIPNVGEEALRNLDEAGIVYIGAEVEPGDILCGKITPKGESPMTPERNCCAPSSARRPSDVRDTSLRLPPGVQGTVVEVRVFNRHGIDIDDRTRAIQTEEKERLKKDADDEKGILNRATFARLKEMLLKQVATAAAEGHQEGRDARRRGHRGRRAATNGGRSPSRTTSARPTSKPSRPSMTRPPRSSTASSRTASRSSSAATSCRRACSRWSRCSSR